MTHNVLKIDAGVLRRLRAFHLAPGKRWEALSYVWATAERTPRGITVLVPHNAPVLLMGEDCYENQSGGNVRLVPEVLNGMLVEFAGGDWNCLINCHDHWFDRLTEFSSIDDRDDLRFDRYLRSRFEPMLALSPHIGPRRAIHNVAMVLANDGLDARQINVRRRRPFRRFDEVQVVGAGWDRMPVGRERGNDCADPRLARHADFVPAGAQAALARMRILLAGCGGLGSVLAEGLARVGVGGINLVDDDRVSLSNLNRWQGGTPADVGAPKARRLATRLRRMFPALDVRSIDRSIYDPEVEALFPGTSIIVAGLDNDEARYFLNRVSAQYLLPYFDAGTVIETGDGDCDFRARVLGIVPGHTPCLECTQLELFDRAGTIEAFLDEATARARRDAGYVMDRPEADAPSVYALNLRTSGLLITELLNYVCGWRPTAFAISESWRSGKVMRYDRDNFPETMHPDCPVCHHYAGTGRTEALPRPRWFVSRELDVDT